MPEIQLPPFRPTSAIYFRSDSIIIVSLCRDVYGRFPPGKTLIRLKYEASDIELGNAIITALHESKATLPAEQFTSLSEDFLSSLGASKGELEARWDRVERNWSLLTISLNEDRRRTTFQKMKRHGKGGYRNDGDPYEVELSADRLGRELRECITNRLRRLR